MGNKRGWLVLLILWASDGLLPRAAAGEEVVLRHEGLAVAIEPASLRVTAQLGDLGPIVVSRGRTGLGRVEGLEVTDRRASWDLPEQRVGVKIGLRDEQLWVRIRARASGAFTWPTLVLDSGTTALIWPHWEGRYVPLDDPRWRSFLGGRTWNTLDNLSMPFWGVRANGCTVTYIATNRFNNGITFEDRGDRVAMVFEHAFPPSKTAWGYGFVIALAGDPSPIEPARRFREWLAARGAFVSLVEKVEQVPKVAWLRGAPHVYLWGDALLSRHDIDRRAWQPFCRGLLAAGAGDAPSVGRRLRRLMGDQAWAKVQEIATAQWPSRYLKSEVCRALSGVLARADFYADDAWMGITLPEEAQALLAQDRAALSAAELSRMNSLLLRSAYPDALPPVDDWGDGVSLKMLRRLQAAGLERIRLCVAGWQGVERRPAVVRAADEMGYLFGTYDSFHSIHPPKLRGTDASWPTAQFNRALFETGGMQRADGTMRGGFKQRGYRLNPLAARPYVERRVWRNMGNVPFNYYFVDCDAYGQVFDDYSPSHPMTQAQDAAARADRLAWIRDTFDVVIGSEGGCSYFAPTIHVSEGMLTPVIGWDDPDMRDRESKYYRGGYYPPDRPRNFVQAVPLKPEYVYLYYDPRFRLPLNEIVFHDAFVSTHHWAAGSLKFSNVRETVALTEMLYQCPPLYHLNLDEFEEHRDWITRHNAFFAPLHREIGFAPMTDFAWLTADRLVQRTVFDGRVELIANFSEADFARDGLAVPARSVVAKLSGSDERRTFGFGD